MRTLYGVAAALSVFAHQGSGHVMNVISMAGIKFFRRWALMPPLKMRCAPRPRR